MENIETYIVFILSGAVFFFYRAMKRSKAEKSVSEAKLKLKEKKNEIDRLPIEHLVDRARELMGRRKQKQSGHREPQRRNRKKR